jgi:hypothetical protein
MNRFQVIDGQQRLMTLSLLFCALRDVAHNQGFKKFKNEIQERYLIHPYKEGEERFRIYPRRRDRDEYIQAVLSPASSTNGRTGKALEFFIEKIEDLPDSNTEIGLRRFFDVLQMRLQFVYIELDGENPYRIFKSLNSTGVDLSEADLIRNFVFMHVDLNEQDSFDDARWKPLEARFSGEKSELDTQMISRFFRDFLMQQGKYVPVAGTFESFESRYFGTGFSADDLTGELIDNAKLYDIILGRKAHGSRAVNDSLAKLRQLDSSTTNALLMNLLHRAETEVSLGPSDLGKAIELIAGFIMRRLVCGDSSRTYGHWFVQACGVLGKNPIKNLADFLISKGFPTTARFEESFTHFNLYESRYSRSVLESIERSFQHKEPADITKATVEHIMPRVLTSEWRTALGHDASRIHEEWLHTPGNLTLSAYNSELYNHPFAQKRKEYAKSNIILNRQLAELSDWTGEQIQIRGKALAQKAAQIWKGPEELEIK